MQIGKLDQVIQIQEPTESNVSGSITTSFSTIATVRGRVVAQRGDELLQSDRIMAVDRIRIQLRYRSDIDNKWRIIWLDQTYYVINTDRSNKRKGEIWLTCDLVGAL